MTRVLQGWGEIITGCAGQAEAGYTLSARGESYSALCVHYIQSDIKLALF